VNPAELQRAQDEARRKAQADQEARLAAERQKIDDERKKAEEARAAEAAKAAAEASPLPTAVSSPTPSLATPAPSAPASALTTPPSLASPGPSAGPSAPAAPPLYDLSDTTVVPPLLVSQTRIEYPPIARAQRVTGTVVISALVDENGNVVEARVIRGVSTNLGLNQAALQNVKGRKYKPATLNGKPGRAWVAIQIDFKL
jgi:protein TonB